MKLWPSSSRWLALILLALAVSLALSACQAGTKIPQPTADATTVGSPPTAAPSATAQPSPTATATPRPTPAFKGMTIEFWHPWQGDLAKQVDEAVMKFNLTNEWGFRVSARPFYNNSSLVDAVEAGAEDKANGLPDVLAAPSDQLVSWSTRDIGVIDLNAYLTDPGYGMAEKDRAAFYPVFWEQDQAGEQQVGIPALRSARVLFYNETWAKELGFNGPPKTPAEFKTQACAAAQNNNRLRVIDKFGTGGWIVDNNALTMLSWMEAFGAQPVPAESGQPYGFDGKEAEEAWTFLRGMLDEGCAWVARDPDPYDYFSSRMALFYSGSLPEMITQTNWKQKAQGQDNWRVVPFMSKAGKPVVYSSGESYAVFKGEPDTELAAWLFLRWMAQPEVAVKFTQALPSLPVSSSQTEQLKNAQAPWNMILPLVEAARPAPTLESWRPARRLIEDAAWQLFHAPPEQAPHVLPYLNEVLGEITK